MKKFIITVISVLAVVLAVNYAYFHLGIYIPLPHDSVINVNATTDGKQILLKENGEFKPFEIKGVDLGSGYPGEWSTDFNIEKETYMRWFEMMQEMGVNTVRIYTIQSQPFYEAFYEYNNGRENPLYLLHGVWVNDHVMNSYKDAYHKDFYDTFLNDCKIMVDAIHGNRMINLGKVASAGHGSYLKDISPWVIGYILGVEWEDLVVAYTDDKYKDDEDILNYSGKYFYTSPDASAFEAMLTRVADKVTDYETKRYGDQRLIAFANWPTTDPFTYPTIDRAVIKKCATVNVENILPTPEFKSGQFASYHVYPYFPDYLTYVANWQDYGLDENIFKDEKGALNTYRAYLALLTNHHSIPVVISEFGIPTSRAMAHIDVNTGRNQGAMSEDQQGDALVECYNDIKAAGCAGSCIFSWQDEWFKRTWNTLHSVDLKRNPYWSDYQTNEQFFGILTFDPGAEKSVCYVDGDVSEWSDEDIVFDNSNNPNTNNIKLSMKYDEKFVYFLINKNGLDFENDTIYLPIDTTQKSGSTYCENFNLKFNRGVDFLVILNGSNNSRVMVQERYEALRSTYAMEIYKFNTYETSNIPDKDSPEFKDINLILHKKAVTTARSEDTLKIVFETGQLTYGNANPESSDFNSLADFCTNGDYIELKLPWQILNFGDPSEMMIHDDYYDENYGIQFIKTDRLYIGAATDTSANIRTELHPFMLKEWGNDPTFHERLKQSYYAIKQLWGGTDK